MKPDTKRPSIKEWPGFQAILPENDCRQDWLARFADHGIGINTGTEICPGEILVGIDVDDDRLVRLVDGMIPGADCAKR